MNLQKKESKIASDGNVLDIVDIFDTIQGEGPFSGERAIFIRLAGCNLTCPSCFGIKQESRIPYVRQAIGSKKKFTEVVEGDVLLTFDESFNLVETTVTKIIERHVDSWLQIIIDGTKYFVTHEHPFVTPRGIIRADELIVGDDIYEAKPNDIISWKKTGDRNPMKNPEVAEKSAANTDYKAQGKTISETLQRQKTEGTYVNPYSKLTDEQKISRNSKISTSKLGVANPNWKGGKYQNWELLRGMIFNGSIKECSSCGSNNNLEIHHIDENHENDSTDNLAILCKSCHTKVHQKGYNFWNGERRDGKELIKAIKHNGKKVEEIKEYDRNKYSPSIRPKPLKVRNFSCAPYNTFLLDDMWVHNCDTDYTSNRKKMSLSTILGEVNSIRPSGLVVITGGEPFRQELGPLINLLIENHYVQIETNGTLPPPESVKFSYDFAKRKGVYIVCSPKTTRLNEDLRLKVAAFKYVIAADSVSAEDGLPIQALKHKVQGYVQRPWVDCPVYIQPEDSGNPDINWDNVQATIDSCKKFGYTMQLQTHKLIGVK